MSGSRRAALDKLLDPASIAVVGASQNPVRVGGRVVRFLTDGGYAGAIMPVNPAREQILGLPCYPSVAELPRTPDMAVLAVRADQTAQAIRDLGRNGVTAAIAMAAGFREAGAEGARLEQELVGAAREAGVTVLGPNSAGYRNTAKSLYATFGSDAGLSPLAGSIAVVSQSGGLAGYFGAAVAKTRGVGHKWIIDTGNEIDVEVSDCIEYLAHDADVSAIGLITEGCRDGDRLRAAFDLARELGKPVVALKIGRSEAGARAAASHTGALAGSDGVYDAVFRHHGVHRARDERELIDALGLYDAGAVPRGRGVAVFSLSGGVATTLVDTCDERGLHVPPIEPPDDPAIAAALPASRFENPLDLTGQIGVEPQLLGPVLDHVASLPQIDAVLLGFAYMLQVPRIAEIFVPAVIGAAKRSGKPMVVVGLATPEAERELHAHGVIVEPYPTAAVDALAAVNAFVADERGPRAQPAMHSAPSASGSPPDDPAIRDAVAQRGHDLLVGAEAAARLPGIPFVESEAVASAQQALELAARQPGPVVLKGESAAIAHKTELGLVRVGLDSPEKVRDAFEQIDAALAQAGGGEIVLQPALEGVEMVLGLRNDPTFGPVVMVGSGGIFIEIQQDVAFGVPPLTRADAERMVRSLRGFPLLAGARGRAPAAIEDLIDALLALAELAAAHGHEIAELDVNPFIVGARPGTSAAVDAVLLLEPSRAQETSPA